MKYFILALIIVGTSFAFVNEDGAGLGTSSPGLTEGGSTDDWVLTVINTFECSYAQHILGLDYVEDEHLLLFASNMDDKFFVADPNSGAYVSEFDLPYTDPHPWGVTDCATGGSYDGPHLNDFFDTFIHWYDWSTWQVYDNPYEDNGRGMDYHDGYIWEAFGEPSATYGAVLQMEPGGTPYNAWNLPGITSQMSGITAYDAGGAYLGIAGTTYDDHFLYLYEFTGSGFNSLGTAELPTCDSSLGLAYSWARGTFYWSHKIGSTYYISEMELEWLGLEPATWGSIKTSF